MKQYLVLCLLFFANIKGKETINNNFFDLKKLENKKNLIEVAVIGAGVAGLTAAIFLARASKQTVVYGGTELFGGQLTKTSYVENLPGIKKKLGAEIMQDMLEQAEEFGAIVKQETITKVDFSVWPFKLWTETEEVHALSVVIATGAKPRLLGIPGEKEYWGYGVSTCAVCDSLFFKDKAAFIVGAGEVAVEDAMQLSPYAKTVTILVRKSAMKAAKSIQDKLKSYSNVSVIYNKIVKEVIGDGQLVTGLKIEDVLTNKQEVIPADGIFLAIGHDPNTSLFKDYLDISKEGYMLLRSNSQETSINGIFAAGDVEDPKYKIAPKAEGSGSSAALDCVEFLRHLDVSIRSY